MKMRALSGSAVLAVAATTVMVLSALPVSATPAAGHGARPLRAGRQTGQNLSSVVARSWQTDGTVWAIAAARGHVYVGGQFTSVRPPGAAAGHRTVARAFLAEFSARTGALQAFRPTLDGEVTALAVSPNGGTLYVGGGFTHITTAATGRVPRERLAAFSTVTGALRTSWKPTANSKVLSIAPSPGRGSSIYLGGNFTSLDGQARGHAGAVNRRGNLLPWAPNLNGSVTSVAVAPDETRVLVGGYFTTINGVTQQAIGSTNPSTGASEPWAATIVPNRPGCVSDVKDIIVRGGTAYIANEGTGGGCFDGDFAANISDGALVWQNDCLGATQSLAVVNGWLYKGSHAHDCAYSPGGFPQVNNPAGGWFTHHLLNQSLTDGSLGHWTPNTDNTSLGPRVMATDGTQLFVGGSFLTVNGRPQQGFARFAPGPDLTTPARPAAPEVTSTSAGVVSVTFSAVSDPDDGTLTYSIYRDGRRKPIARLTATSWPWARPVVHYRDAGRAPHSRHTYRVTASDGASTSAKSPASAPVTVTSKNPPRSYAKTVLRGGPSFFWPLSEKSGKTAKDASGNGFDGIYEPGTTHRKRGPIAGSRATATAFNGKKGLVTSARQVSSPQAFTVEGWFKTSTNRGGKLIGFGSSQTGQSASYDRQIYMQNDGQLVFGVASGGIHVVVSGNVYNDGTWHFVVASLSRTAGMALFVDGQLVGSNPTTSDQSYSGFWRVGGDNLSGWNLDPWGSNSQGTTQPYSYYFRGVIGDVAVFGRALSARRIAAQYAANGLSH